MIFGMDIDFKTEQADSIIQHCETALGMDDMETWLHCLSVAVGLCPSKDMTIAAIEIITVKKQAWTIWKFGFTVSQSPLECVHQKRLRLQPFR